MTALDAFLNIAQEISPDAEYLVDMDSGGPGTVPFKVAHIATDLVPLADECLTGRSQVDIVGYDGGSVSEEHYRWRSDLVRWVDLGNHVRYLLLKPSREAILQLEQQAEKLSHAPGTLQVIVLNEQKALKPEDELLLQRWETFHFISFNAPKQLWVEKFHPAGLTATDCTYFPPAAAERSALWDMLTKQFRYVVETYGKDVISAGGAMTAARIEPALEFA